MDNARPMGGTSWRRKQQHALVLSSKTIAVVLAGRLAWRLFKAAGEIVMGIQFAILALLPRGGGGGLV